MLEGVLGVWISPWAIALTAGAATLATLAVLKRRAPPRCDSKVDLTGKTAIVTGANTGIGLDTAQGLAARNARVIVACRSKERGMAAREKIITATGNNNIIVQVLDLSSLSSVRQFASEIQKQEERLDILVNNAGVYGAPQKCTEDGLELNMATNHFGHFLLTCLLMDLMKKSAPSRVVNVSSAAQKFAKEADIFDSLHAEKSVLSFVKYGATKLAALLFTRELHHHLDGTGVTVYCVHPGTVNTDIARNMHWTLRLLFLMQSNFTTPQQGAQTSLYCAVTEGIEHLSGKYFVDCGVAEDKVNPAANNPEVAKRLWRISEELTGLS